MTINQKIADYEAEILKLGTGNVHDLQTAKNISALYGAKIALETIFKNIGTNTQPTKENAIQANFEAVSGEYGDILPELKNYFNKKRDFRQGKVTQAEVNHSLERLTVEITDFLVLLRSNTCCEEERQILAKIKL